MCVVRSCISSHDSLIQKPISGKLVWFNEYLCLRLIFHPETLLSLTVILSLIWSLYLSFVYILLNVKYTLQQAKNFITSSLLLIFIFCHKDSSLHTENALWSTSEYFIITILSKEKREWWDSLRLILPFVDMTSIITSRLLHWKTIYSKYWLTQRVHCKWGWKFH